MDMNNGQSKKLKKMRFIAHYKIRNVNVKKKKKARLPLITAYRNLKHRNHDLAQALTKQMEENKELRDDILSLQSKNLHLTLACNRRDEALLRIEQQTKDNLSIMTSFANTAGCVITTCRKFTTNTNQQIDSNQSSRKSVLNKSSVKSPSCVVLPTVSGHTITKPTINLSRVNMQRVRNMQNLSVIEESSPRNSVLNHTSLSSRSSEHNLIINEENIHNLPDRIHLLNLTNEEELSRPSSVIRGHSQGHSRRVSNSSRKSFIEQRLTNGSPNLRKSIIRSPRVQLKDVAKLLQNSQTINVRKLSERFSNEEKENIVEEQDQQNCSSSSEQNSNQSIEIGKENADFDTSQHSRNSKENLQNILVESNDEFSRNETQNNNTSSSYIDDDPLEGPSWKFENTFTSANRQRDSNKLEKSTVTNIFNVENNSDDESDEDDRIKINNYVNFVNRQRGSSTDIDDFTLLIRKNNHRRKTRFNINDLTLPVLETPLIQPQPLATEPDDITCTFHNITENLPTFAFPNNYMNDISFTTRIPRLSDVTANLKKESPVQESDSPVPKRKRVRDIQNLAKKQEQGEDDTMQTKIKKRQKKQKTSEKDPSTAKVVLNKLKHSENATYYNDSSPNGQNSLLHSPVYMNRTRECSKDEILQETDSEFEMEDIVERPKHKSSKTKTKKSKKKPENFKKTQLHSSDSEGSVDSKSTTNRPKRKVAPKNLTEPSIQRKLRR